MRTALWIAAAAVLVTAPRLALAYLEADRIAVPASWRAGSLVLTAVATAIVLTVGAAYLAHATAVAASNRAALAAFWGAAVLCQAVLIAPAIAAVLPGSVLAKVLTTAQARWIWSIAACLGVDLVAAGCMLAASTPSRDRAEDPLPDPLMTRSGLLDMGLHRVGTGYPTPSPQAPPAPPPLFPCPAGCDRVFETLDKARGHLAQCPKRRQEREGGSNA